MSNGTQYLIPWFEPAKEWAGIERYRFCLDGLCAPCPYEDSFFGAQHGILMDGLFYTALVALVMNVFILLFYALLPRNKTMCTIYSTGTAVANIIFTLGFLLGRATDNPAPTLCYDSITRATGPRVPRCALSGFFFVYGLLSSRFWLLIWVLDMHFKILYNKTFYGYRRNWAIGFVVLVPLALALISVPFLDYLSGPVCLPAYGYPLDIIVEVPIALSNAGIGILQGWSLVCVVKVLMKVRHTAIQGPSSARSSQVTAPGSTLSQLKDQPVVRACTLLARPIIYTQLIHVSNLLLGVSFVYSWGPINSHGRISPSWKGRIATWLTCLANGATDKGGCLLPGSHLVQLRTASLYFALLVCMLFVGLCIRIDGLIALRDLLTDFYSRPFQRDRRSDCPADLFETKASIFSKPIVTRELHNSPLDQDSTQMEVHQTYVKTDSLKKADITEIHCVAQKQQHDAEMTEDVALGSFEMCAHSTYSGTSRPLSFESNASRDRFNTSSTDKLNETTIEAKDETGYTLADMLPWNQKRSTIVRRSIDSDVRPPEDFHL